MSGGRVDERSHPPVVPTRGSRPVIGHSVPVSRTCRTRDEAASSIGEALGMDPEPTARALEHFAGAAFDAEGNVVAPCQLPEELSADRVRVFAEREADARPIAGEWFEPPPEATRRSMAEALHDDRGGSIEDWEAALDFAEPGAFDADGRFVDFPPPRILVPARARDNGPEERAPVEARVAARRGVASPPPAEAGRVSGSSGASVDPRAALEDLAERTLDDAARLQATSGRPGGALVQALQQDGLQEEWAQSLAAASPADADRAARLMAERFLATRGTPVAPGEVDRLATGIRRTLDEAVYREIADRAVGLLAAGASATVDRLEGLDRSGAVEVGTRLCSVFGPTERDSREAVTARIRAATGALVAFGLGDEAASQMGRAIAMGEIGPDQVADQVLRAAPSRAAELRRTVLAPLAHDDMRRYDAVAYFGPAVQEAARQLGYDADETGRVLGDGAGAVGFREAMEADRVEDQAPMIVLRVTAAVAMAVLFPPAGVVLSGSFWASVGVSAGAAAAEQAVAEPGRSRTIALVREAIAEGHGTPGMDAALERERAACWGSVLLAAAAGGASARLPGAPALPAAETLRGLGAGLGATALSEVGTAALGGRPRAGDEHEAPPRIGEDPRTRSRSVAPPADTRPPEPRPWDPRGIIRP